MTNPPQIKHRNGEPRMWAAMKAADKWTAEHIAEASGSARASVYEYARRLVKAGFVETTDPVVALRFMAQLQHFRVIKPVIESPRIKRDGTLLPRPLNYKIWEAMDYLAIFEARQIAGIIGDLDGDQVEYINKFLATLCRAKVIMMVREADVAGGFREYRRSVKSGPYPPQILRGKVIYDPNTAAYLTPLVLEEASR